MAAEIPSTAVVQNSIDTPADLLDLSETSSLASLSQSEHADLDTNSRAPSVSSDGNSPLRNFNSDWWSGSDSSENECSEDSDYCLDSGGSLVTPTSGQDMDLSGSPTLAEEVASEQSSTSDLMEDDTDNVEFLKSESKPENAMVLDDDVPETLTRQLLARHPEYDHDIPPAKTIKVLQYAMQHAAEAKANVENTQETKPVRRTTSRVTSAAFILKTAIKTAKDTSVEDVAVTSQTRKRALHLVAEDDYPASKKPRLGDLPDERVLESDITDMADTTSSPDSQPSSSDEESSTESPVQQSLDSLLTREQAVEDVDLETVSAQPEEPVLESDENMEATEPCETSLPPPVDEPLMGLPAQQGFDDGTPEASQAHAGEEDDFVTTQSVELDLQSTATTNVVANSDLQIVPPNAESSIESPTHESLEPPLGAVQVGVDAEETAQSLQPAENTVQLTATPAADTTAVGSAQSPPHSNDDSKELPGEEASIGSPIQQSSGRLPAAGGDEAETEVVTGQSFDTALSPPLLPLHNDEVLPELLLQQNSGNPLEVPMIHSSLETLPGSGGLITPSVRDVDAEAKAVVLPPAEPTLQSVATSEHSAPSKSKPLPLLFHMLRAKHAREGESAGLMDGKVAVILDIEKPDNPGSLLLLDYYPLKRGSTWFDEKTRSKSNEILDETVKEVLGPVKYLFILDDRSANLVRQPLDFNPDIQVKLEADTDLVEDLQDDTDTKHIYTLFFQIMSRSIRPATLIDASGIRADIIAKIVTLASKYDALPVIREHMSTFFHKQGQRFWKAIRTDPALWLSIATTLEDSAAFKEAAVHIIGCLPDWPWPTKSSLFNNDTRIQDMLFRKSDELMLKISFMNLKLGLNRVCTKPLPEYVPPSKPGRKKTKADLESTAAAAQKAEQSEPVPVTAIHDPNAWVMQSYWHDWLRLSLGKLRHSGERNAFDMDKLGYFYRMIENGEYLRYGKSLGLGLIEPSFENETWVLTEMKKYAGEVVKPLLESSLQYRPVGDDSPGWLTCVKIENCDLPFQCDGDVEMD